jgi:hypothetical protein
MQNRVYQVLYVDPNTSVRNSCKSNLGLQESVRDFLQLEGHTFISREGLELLTEEDLSSSHGLVFHGNPFLTPGIVPLVQSFQSNYPNLVLMSVGCSVSSKSTSGTEFVYSDGLYSFTDVDPKIILYILERVHKSRN